MTQNAERRELVKVEDHRNCNVSLIWFSFRRAADPLSRLRRRAYLAHETRFPKSPRRRLTNTLSWPLKAIRLSWEASGIWGEEARSIGAPPRTAQFIALWWLAVRHNQSSQVYYLHKLWLKRSGVRPEHWLDGWDYHVIYPMFRDDERSRLLDDKLAFDAFCRRNALPALSIVAVVSGKGQVEWREPDGRLPPADLFVKPAAGSLGQGTAAYSYIASDGGWQSGDRILDESELLDSVIGSADGAEMLVQRRVRNHPEIADLSPDALCTLRCVTYRFRNESSRHLRSVLRMGRRGRIVDHAVHGGLLAAVDDQGLLGKPRDRHVAGALDRHPDTGALIAGRQLPHYQAMRELAVRAHDALGIAGIVSWDVGLLESGPVLVEGNSKGHLDLVQMAHDEPLGLTEYVEIAERLLRECEDPGQAKTTAQVVSS